MHWTHKVLSQLSLNTLQLNVIDNYLWTDIFKAGQKKIKTNMTLKQKSFESDYTLS